MRLRRISILLLGRMFYRYLLGLVLYSVQVFYFLINLCLVVLPIMESLTLESPTIIVELSIFPFNSDCFYFVYFGYSAVRCVTFIIVISS